MTQAREASKPPKLTIGNQWYTEKGRSCLPLRRKYEPILSFLSRVAQIPRHQEHALLLPFHAQPTGLDFIALKDDDGDCYEKQVHIGQIKVLISLVLPLKMFQSLVFKRYGGENDSYMLLSQR